MPTTSTSTTSSTVGATNPSLNNLFTSIFGGGLGTSAGSTLKGVMSGSTMQSNTAQLYKTLQSSTQPQFQKGMAQVRETAAKAGLSNSTSLTGQMGSYTNEYLGNLTKVATEMGLSETQMQGGAASGIMGMLAQAGSQYYTNSSTTQASTMDWSKIIMEGIGMGANVATGGLSGLASMFA